MTTELSYLTWTAVLAILLWLPYIGATVLKFGFLTAADYKEPSQKDLPPWIARAHRAHLNALENLPTFAVLVLVAHATGANNETTATAAAVVFWARVVQTLVHMAGTPYLRTLVFAVGWMAQLTIAWQLLA